MQTFEYELNEIERDVRAEVFREGTVWRELVAACGQKAALIVARHHGGGRVYILSEDTVTEKARKRSFKKNN